MASAHTLLNLGGLVLVFWLVLVNGWLFMLMMKDKRAAGRDKTRTPEATLLALALFGASPTLLFGRRFLRHKTQKASFINAMYAVIVVQVGLLGWYLTK